MEVAAGLQRPGWATSCICPRRTAQQSSSRKLVAIRGSVPHSTADSI